MRRRIEILLVSTTFFSSRCHTTAFFWSTDVARNGFTEYSQVPARELVLLAIQQVLADLRHRVSGLGALNVGACVPTMRDMSHTTGAMASTRRRALLALAAAALVPGCRRGPADGEWYSAWDLDGGCLSRLAGATRHDARGEPADFCDAVADGRWIWVFYGAPWCSSSRSQAVHLRDLVRHGGSRLLLFSVLTSGAEPLTVPRLADALAWAHATGLEPGRVLYDPFEKDTRTVPQHLLVGPDGRTWWRWAGVLDGPTLIERFEAFASGRLPAQARKLPPLAR